MDALLSLAFSVYANPGAYALLIGSGLSRSAGIPTGWEVVLDLIRKTAALRDEDPGDRPETWFERTFGQPPNYSTLLEMLSPSASERRQLLESYFEPNAEEREQELKTPTPGHRAIAGLIAEGLVKVVITTNFDRLMEHALSEAGISPVVISTPDNVLGAPPLQHSRCTIVKVHGDYLDARIRNSPTELESYDAETNKLLDTIFDNYGVIVCGWSGEWDAALRGALERSPSRRYTLFWTHVWAPGPLAERLIALKNGQKIPIASADRFFAELAEKTSALRSLADRHPLSRNMAVQTVRKYTADPKHAMRLAELVMEEAERVQQHLRELRTDSAEPTGALLLERMMEYEKISADLAALLAVGCYWGQELHHRTWITALQMLVPDTVAASDPVWQSLQRYPAVLCLYAAGIGAVGAGQYETLGALFTGPRATYNGQDEPFGGSMFAWSVLQPDVMFDRNLFLPGLEKSWCPISHRLEAALQPLLQEVLPPNFPFTWHFDRFELMTSLAINAFNENETGANVALDFRGWNGRSKPESVPHLRAAVREIKAQQERWPPFRMGFLPVADKNQTGPDKVVAWLNNSERSVLRRDHFWSGQTVREALKND